MSPPKAKKSRKTIPDPAFPDLSRCNLDVLEAILLRVPKKDLLVNCLAVCSQWNSLLNSRAFWLAKEDYDGEDYLRGLLSLDHGFDDEDLNYGKLSVKKPFNHNLLADFNPDGDEITKHCDTRWQFYNPRAFQYMSPPLFYSGQFAPDFEPKFDGCYELSYRMAYRVFDCSFKDLGISDEIIEKYRPSITFTEYVAHRADCGARYSLRMRLFDGNGVEVHSQETTQVFEQWQLQKWVKKSITFTSYDPSVRRIRIESGGRDTKGWAGHYGPKIAGSSLVIEFKRSQKTEYKIFPIAV